MKTVQTSSSHQQKCSSNKVNNTNSNVPTNLATLLIDYSMSV